MSTRCAQTSLPEARLRPKLWPPFPELLLQKTTNTRLENRSALQGLSELAPIGGGHHCLIMKLKCLLCQPVQRLTSCVFLSCLSSSLLRDCRASEPQHWSSRHVAQAQFLCGCWEYCLPSKYFPLYYLPMPTWHLMGSSKHPKTKGN